MIWKTAQGLRELEANAARGCIPVAPFFEITGSAAFHGVIQFSGVGSVSCLSERMGIIPPTANLRGTAQKTTATHRH